MIKKNINYDELVANILKRLCEADNPEDITLDVCQRTSYSWYEAEAFVRRVQEENKLNIAKEQFPLMYGVAFAIFLCGLALTGFGIYGIFISVTANNADWGPRDITSYFMPVIEKGTDPVVAFQPAILPYFNLILGFIFSPIAALCSGIAMIIGSLFGMRDVWSDLLNR